MRIMRLVIQRGLRTAAFVAIVLAAHTASAAPVFDFSQELVSVTPEGASDFSFLQSGYAEGAFVTGTFSGTDDDANGQLSSFAGEITGFSMQFSGNSIVPAFSMGIPALVFALVYDLDGGALGDGLAFESEGIVAFDGLTAYLVGPGPGEGPSAPPCGVGEDCAIVGGFVPEPGLAFLCVIGLAAAVRYRANRRATRC